MPVDSIIIPFGPTTCGEVAMHCGGFERVVANLGEKRLPRRSGLDMLPCPKQVERGAMCRITHTLLLLGAHRFADVDIRIRVKGGGDVAQVYAIRQAIAKSLVAYYQKCESTDSTTHASTPHRTPSVEIRCNAKRTCVWCHHEP